jgi:hypothetical protein
VAATAARRLRMDLVRWLVIVGYSHLSCQYTHGRPPRRVAGQMMAPAPRPAGCSTGQSGLHLQEQFTAQAPC